MGYVPIRQSHMGQHYRKHRDEWREKYPNDYEHEHDPMLTCKRCKVSYFLQELRWALNGDIIA